jgi:hypothetical protein
MLEVIMTRPTEQEHIQVKALDWLRPKEPTMSDRGALFGAMWRRRQQVWEESAKKERRYAEEAIFRALKDQEGDKHGQEDTPT